MGAPVSMQVPPQPKPVFSLKRAKETAIRWAGNVQRTIQIIDTTVSNGIETQLKKICTEATAKKITEFVMRVLRGLPVAASLFLLPTPVAFGLMATGLMVDIIKPGVLGDKWSVRMFQSIGLHTAIRSIMDAVRMASQSNGFFYLGLLIFDVAAAAYCYKRIDKF